MSHDDAHRPRQGFGYVRALSQREELPLLRDHLLRLDPISRHDRFNGFMDDDFIERYAAKCADDGTIIVAYMESGIVRGAANEAMRALASKFGAHLVFRHGESTGTIEVDQAPQAGLARLAIDGPLDAARVVMNFNRAWWKMLVKMYRGGRAA